MIWKSRLNQRLAQLADFLTVSLCILLSYPIWVLFYPGEELLPSSTFKLSLLPAISLLVFISILFIVLFNYFRAYNFHRFTSLVTEYANVIKVTIFGWLFTISLLYIIKFWDISRVFIAISITATFTGLFLQKTVMFFMAKVIRRNQSKKRIILIGNTTSIRNIVGVITKNFNWGLHIQGIVLSPDDPENQVIDSCTILGSYNDIGRILTECNPEEVIISISSNDFAQLKYVYEECEKVGVQIRLVSDFFTHMARNVAIDNVYGINLISFYPYFRTNLDKLMKRLIDVVLSLLSIVFLTPLFLIIIIVIYLQDGWPVFFKWKVMGLNRRPITSWKFRTMYRDADERKKELLKYNEMHGPMFKMDNDPRIFPAGRLLRKFSLDELPQLFSVLIGDLSLVGPRPPLQYEFKEFDLWHRRKLSVKPGITCLWQISGRNHINHFDDWVRLDLEYIDNWSLLLDIKILVKTIPAVLKGTGK